jgi:hypothetical protein
MCYVMRRAGDILNKLPIVAFYGMYMYQDTHFRILVLTAAGGL